jgi:hypothetical protein
MVVYAFSHEKDVPYRPLFPSRLQPAYYYSLLIIPVSEASSNGTSIQPTIE